MSPRADGSAEKSEGDRAGRASVGLRKNRKEPARGWDRGACSRRTEADSGIEYYSIPWVLNSAALYIYIYIYKSSTNQTLKVKSTHVAFAFPNSTTQKLFMIYIPNI
jgi:hypothetical protein